MCSATTTFLVFSRSSCCYGVRKVRGWAVSMCDCHGELNLLLIYLLINYKSSDSAYSRHYDRHFDEYCFQSASLYSAGNTLNIIPCKSGSKGEKTTFPVLWLPADCLRSLRQFGGRRRGFFYLWLYRDQRRRLSSTALHGIGSLLFPFSVPSRIVRIDYSLTHASIVVVWRFSNGISRTVNSIHRRWLLTSKGS